MLYKSHRILHRECHPLSPGHDEYQNLDTLRLLFLQVSYMSTLVSCLLLVNDVENVVEDGFGLVVKLGQVLVDFL